MMFQLFIFLLTFWRARTLHKSYHMREFEQEATGTLKIAKIKECLIKGLFTKVGAWCRESTRGSYYYSHAQGTKEGDSERENHTEGHYEGSCGF